jgi:Uma2 family endonuclease
VLFVYSQLLLIVYLCYNVFIPHIYCIFLGIFMVNINEKKLTLEEFFALKNDNITYELIEGEAIPKMSPKRFHSRVTLVLSLILNQWNQAQEKPGEIGIEWAISLTKNGQNWCPVPDLLYISNDRLKNVPFADEACIYPPELVIEIISPNQSFSDLSEKAIDYLNNGIERVWIIDNSVKKVTIFYPNCPPKIKKNNDNLADEILPNLTITPQEIFDKAGLNN